ncbi:demethylmenaquinone methyltransferase [Lentilactobacillus kisonensis]|nr:demethylmenaquinone methyltransferase [Lentilactobacillus kisonensis]
MSLTNKTPESQVESLFNELAPNYDSMNSLISLGLHRKWRRIAMKELHHLRGAFVIDVCCGTGDWTVALAKAVGPAGRVVGLDFSEDMLAVAKKKIAAAGVSDRVTLVSGDAMELPYADDEFDVATIGFGLRNVPDANRVLAEMVRVVHPNGQIESLETSKPTSPLLKLGWWGYFKIVPVMAQFAVGKYREYSYLQQTAKQFVTAKQLAQMFRKAGMTNVSYRLLTFGAAALHLGRAEKSE